MAWWPAPGQTHRGCPPLARSAPVVGVRGWSAETVVARAVVARIAPDTRQRDARTPVRSTLPSEDPGVSHLNIHPNMFRQATHEQLGLLVGAEVIVGVAEHRIVALCILLDRRGER
jgi:hypothetical protein